MFARTLVRGYKVSTVVDARVAERWRIAA